MLLIDRSELRTGSLMLLIDRSELHTGSRMVQMNFRQVQMDPW